MPGNLALRNLLRWLEDEEEARFGENRSTFDPDLWKCVVVDERSCPLQVWS